MAERNWFTRAASAVGRKMFGIGESVLTGTSALFGTPRGGTKTLSEVEAIKTFRNFVFTCAGRNGASVASVPLRLYAKGSVSTRDKAFYKSRSVPHAQHKHMLKQRPALGDEVIVELTNHPVLDVLRLANPRTVGFALRELTTIYQELTGNAYWYLEPHGDAARGAQPKAIWNLQPHLMRPVPTKDGKDIKGYLYGPTASNAGAPSSARDMLTSALDSSSLSVKPTQPIAFAPEEIIHFRYPNPESTIKGLGPAQAATSAIHRKTAMDEYKRAMYDNDCVPAFIVRVPEDTPASEIRSLEAQWKDKFRSRRGRGVNIKGVPWITTAEKSIETLNVPPNKMQDVLQAKLDRNEIYEIFGNPVQMAEIGKSRAELEAALTAYMWLTILPRLQRMEQTLTEQLAVLYDPRLFFAFDDPVPDNREQKRQDLDTYVARNIMTVNEARQELGLEPFEEVEGEPAGGADTDDKFAMAAASTYVSGGVMTVNEARTVLGLGPIAGGDTIIDPAAPPARVPPDDQNGGAALSAWGFPVRQQGGGAALGARPFRVREQSPCADVGE